MGPLHDRIICKWRQCLLGGQKWNEKNYSTTVNKIIRTGQRSLKSKSFIKQTPPKVGILIQTTISKFSKTKNLTQKRPPKVPKNQKHIHGGLIQKFYKTDPPKSRNSDSKYNFKIFKTKNQTKKKTPQSSKKKKKKKKKK